MNKTTTLIRNKSGVPGTVEAEVSKPGSTSKGSLASVGFLGLLATGIAFLASSSSNEVDEVEQEESEWMKIPYTDFSYYLKASENGQIVYLTVQDQKHEVYRCYDIHKDMFRNSEGISLVKMNNDLDHLRCIAGQFLGDFTDIPPAAVCTFLNHIIAHQSMSIRKLEPLPDCQDPKSETFLVEAWKHQQINSFEDSLCYYINDRNILEAEIVYHFESNDRSKSFKARECQLPVKENTIKKEALIQALDNRFISYSDAALDAIIRDLKGPTVQVKFTREDTFSMPPNTRAMVFEITTPDGVFKSNTWCKFNEDGSVEWGAVNPRRASTFEQIEKTINIWTSDWLRNDPALTNHLKQVSHELAKLVEKRRMELTTPSN